VDDAGGELEVEVLVIAGELPLVTAIEVLGELAEGVVEQRKAVEPVVALLRLEAAEEVVAGVVVAVVVVEIGAELEVEVVVLVPLLFLPALFLRHGGGGEGAEHPCQNEFLVHCCCNSSL
jgi:hypothetical protein